MGKSSSESCRFSVAVFLWIWISGCLELWWKNLQVLEHFIMSVSCVNTLIYTRWIHIAASSPRDAHRVSLFLHSHAKALLKIVKKSVEPSLFLRTLYLCQIWLNSGKRFKFKEGRHKLATWFYKSWFFMSKNEMKISIWNGIQCFNFASDFL